MGEKKPSYSQLLKEIERLQRCLTYDSITGLYRTQEEGRQRIFEIIWDIHKKGKKIGLVRLDLNNLKAWNKEFGHEETDKLFKQFGKKLLSWTKSRGGIAMRFHFKGDEFGILVPSKKDDLGKIAASLNIQLQAPNKKRLDCQFTLGFAHEEEKEVQGQLKTFRPKNEMSKSGALFTALSLVADAREREEERKKKNG